MIKSKHFLLLLWLVLLVGEVFSQNGIVARKGLSAKQKTIEILREEYPSAFQDSASPAVGDHGSLWRSMERISTKFR